MNMKKQIALAAMTLGLSLSFSLGMSGPAQAHEAAAKYGGIVRTVNDLQFELLVKDGGATIYVNDHDVKLPMAGSSGKLLVLNGAEKSEVALQPGTENTLQTKGSAKLAPGAKAVATITLPNKKTVTVRFVIK